MQQHILIIQDISCIGRCSLLAALPLFNTAGIRATPLPTALLSSHTGFPNPARRDLTEDMSAALDHWQKLDLRFDAIHIGYLAGAHQLSVAQRALDLFRREDTKLFVDPVMGDWGKAYSYCDDALLQGFRALCAQADLILPNRTEAAMLLGQPYSKAPDTPQGLLSQLKSLLEAGARSAVITGVNSQPGYTGAVFLGPGMSAPQASLTRQVEGSWPGTGDLFAAALEAALMRGKPLHAAVDTAVRFIVKCLEGADSFPKAARFGAPFEQALPWLSENLSG